VEIGPLNKVRYLDIVELLRDIFLQKTDFQNVFFIEKILSKYYWNFRLVLDDHLKVAITRVTIGDWTWNKKIPGCVCNRGFLILL